MQFAVLFNMHSTKSRRDYNVTMLIFRVQRDMCVHLGSVSKPLYAHTAGAVQSYRVDVTQVGLEAQLVAESHVAILSGIKFATVARAF